MMGGDIQSSKIQLLQKNEEIKIKSI
jgi:hypothetical protein